MSQTPRHVADSNSAKRRMRARLCNGSVMWRPCEGIGNGYDKLLSIDLAEDDRIARPAESEPFPSAVGLEDHEKVGHLFHQSAALEIVGVIRGQASTDRLMSPIPGVSRPL